MEVGVLPLLPDVPENEFTWVQTGVFALLVFAGLEVAGRRFPAVREQNLNIGSCSEK